MAAATAVAMGTAGVAVGLQEKEPRPSSPADVLLEPLMAEQTARIFAGSGRHIGVSIRDLSADELKGGKTSTGVVIDEVEADSPAQKAGFKVGDIVVEFDGERVRSSRQFIRLVTETPEGRSISTVVQRDGQRVTLTVEPRAGGAVSLWNEGGLAFQKPFRFDVPKTAPPMVLKRDAFPPSFESMLGPAGQLGLSVDQLSPQLSAYFGVKEGVLVTTVRDQSNASRAGVKAGDVITSINGTTVATPSDLRRRSQRLEGNDEFTLEIVRDRKPLTLKGKIEPAQPRKSAVKVIV
jgi:serine protease Do